MPKENKATELELKTRIDTVFEMVIKGCSNDFIFRYVAENFQVGERQTENYIRKAKTKIKELNSNEKQEELIDLAIAQINDLYQKNYTIQDFRECRNVIESRAKLLGHYEKDNNQQAGNIMIFEIPDNGRN